MLSTLITREPLFKLMINSTVLFFYYANFYFAVNHRSMTGRAGWNGTSNIRIEITYLQVCPVFCRSPRDAAPYSCSCRSLPHVYRSPVALYLYSLSLACTHTDTGHALFTRAKHSSVELGSQLVAASRRSAVFTTRQSPPSPLPPPPRGTAANCIVAPPPPPAFSSRFENWPSRSVPFVLGILHSALLSGCKFWKWNTIGMRQYNRRIRRKLGLLASSVRNYSENYWLEQKILSCLRGYWYKTHY